MKTRISLLALALCAVAVVCFAASDAMMGTWKLNESKSKLASAAPKNNTVTYEAAGESVKVTIDGTAADGSAIHRKYTRHESCAYGAFPVQLIEIDPS